MAEEGTQNSAGGGFKLSFRGDIIFALLIVAVLAMLILPMPTWMLDISLALSLSFSVLILMTVLFIERPLDLLNNSKGKEVLVHLKGDKQFVGTLLAFDIHINLVLDNIKEMQDGEIKRNLGLTFLRGDTIIFISPASTALKKE